MTESTSVGTHVFPLNGAYMSDEIKRAELRQEALALMRSALGMIDEAGGPADAGAHLDLAICQLEASLAKGPDTRKAVWDS